LPTFTYSSHISAPVERVFAFHERPDAFALLTPPESGVIILRRDAGLQVGAETLINLPLIPLGKGLLRVEWLARHTQYEPPHLFADQQIYGPFTTWKHLHRFTVEGGGTRLTDEITFALPGGAVLNWFAAPFVRLKLRQMFAFRHRITKKYCE
jgi:ligand-binding SRPBCC domain-containing protein